MIDLAKAFWIAFLPAALFAQPILNLLIRAKSRQTVSQYAPETHMKKQGTPTMGGLIVALGVAVAGIALAALHIFHASPEYLTLFVGFAAIGFVDDYVVPRMIKGKRGLGWKQKILMQLVVASAALAIGSSGFGWEQVATVFLILFCSNAYNFADGLDGLAGTLGIIILAGLIAMGLFVGYSASGSIFAACMIGGLVPFLVLNVPPARVFMGDVGSLAIGAAMGLIAADLAFPSVHLGAFDPASEWYLGRVLQTATIGHVLVVPVVLSALAVIGLVLAVELVPVPLQIASVKLRKKKLFTMTPIHHGFEAKGWPESRIVWLFCLTQFMLAVIAVTLVMVPAIAPQRFEPGIRTAANPYGVSQLVADPAERSQGNAIGAGFLHRASLLAHRTEQLAN